MNERICFTTSAPSNWVRPKEYGRENLADWKRRSRLALAADKLWPVGIVLTIGFLNGTDWQRHIVREIASEWTQHANIHFDFSDRRGSQVRIGFHEGGGSWSAVGTDALCEAAFPKGKPTLNFGWLIEGADLSECRRVILHEFGHVLGCIHEHQHPSSTLVWNPEAVYRHYAGYPNWWSKEDIDINVLKRASGSTTVNSPYDQESIMHYHFDGSLLLNPVDLPFNTNLSELDKQHIARLYPVRESGR